MTTHPEEVAMHMNGQADAIQPELPNDGAQSEKCGGRRHFTLTTHFLKRTCYPYLMRSPLESIAYLSGVRCQDTTVVDQLVTFMMDAQSVTYVSGEPVSTSAALITIDELGYFLEGTIHCHPGAGRDATTPSLIDYRHHRRLEAAGYKALGIIMTRDGHVRFYTDHMPFVVDVIGNDVFKLDDTNYRLILTRSGGWMKTDRSKCNEHKGEIIPDDNESDTPRAAVCEGRCSTDAGGAGPAGVSD